MKKFCENIHPTYRNRKINGIQNNAIDYILFRMSDGSEHLGRIEFERIEKRRVKVYIVRSRCFGVHEKYGFNYGYVQPDQVIRKVKIFKIGHMVQYRYHNKVYEGNIIRINKHHRSNLIESYLISGQFKYGNKILISAEDVIEKKNL